MNLDQSQPDRIVPDTSVIVDSLISEAINDGRLEGTEVLMSEAVIAELEAQASRGQETGYAGLVELKRLQQSYKDGLIDLNFAGRRPTRDEIELSESGEIDALIRQIAEDKEATLVTSDRIQAGIAEGKGIKVTYFPGEAKGETPRIENLGLMQYFDDQTMSVHLRANTFPRVKRGRPGDMAIETLSQEKNTVDQLEEFSQEIVEVAGVHEDGFIEMDSGGSTVVQLGNLRIAMAKPPFADAIEITATRPVTKTQIDHYSHADMLKERMQQAQRGVLVAGAPGMGKSTLVQAMAEYLEDSGWIVKTMETPRDLDVSPEISQYTALDGHMSNTADVLLLSRPDYTVFDEMRTTEDFEIYADMRMAGVGLVGVVHATKGIDSLQRLVGRVELGMIPQVADTVVYVKDGDVQQIYDVELSVKVPSGMEERDLARPIIEVREFETSKLEYEIYSFGEEVVVMPVTGEQTRPAWELARREIEYELSQQFDFGFEVQMISDDRIELYVADSNVPVILGRKGERVDELENQLGVGIEVKTFEELETSSNQLDIDISEEYLTLNFDSSYSGKQVEVRIDDQRIFTGAVSKQGDIRLRRGKDPTERIRKAYRQNKDLQVQLLNY